MYAIMRMNLYIAEEYREVWAAAVAKAKARMTPISRIVLRLLEMWVNGEIDID